MNEKECRTLKVTTRQANALANVLRRKNLGIIAQPIIDQVLDAVRCAKVQRNGSQMVELTETAHIDAWDLYHDQLDI